MTKLRDTRLTQREGRETFSIYLRSTLVTKLADYEDIGSADELRELKEKATAKKPIDKSRNPKNWHVMACPNCEHIFWNSGDFVHYEPKFCNYCGQALDWEV